MLTIPVYIAEKLSHSLFSMMFLSGFIATFFTLGGLWFSYTYNLTSGASIILISAASLGAFLLFYRGK
jgi:zinc transport system permease protein